jgi:hypothetical protein
MNILQDISKRLLAVASMPPENRNDALMEVKIEIEGVQYDMVLEQKNLIMDIIDGLIAENDADQIAKSKLVFVPDVEEQIAPTKKTRAKKVVAPVVEVESEDLPDFIGQFPIIRTLPEPVRKLAGLRRKELHQNINNFNENNNLSTAFNWDKAPEGHNFWSKISEDGDLTEFKKKFGNKGEKVDELIEFAELTQFVEGLKQPVAEAPVPLVKTRKPRTPKVAPVVAPVVASQEVYSVELVIYPPSGGVLELKVFSLTELFALTSSVFNRLKMNYLYFNFKANTDLGQYTTKIELKTSDGLYEVFKKLTEQYDTFVFPKLNWDGFEVRKSVKDRVELNEEILLDAFKPTPKTVPVVTPKVVTPKVVTPKPVKVVTPKVVTTKLVKVVAPKVVKTKVIKPKVEDDLSFLNDLDNIF